MGEKINKNRDVLRDQSRANKWLAGRLGVNHPGPKPTVHLTHQSTLHPKPLSLPVKKTNQ